MARFLIPDVAKGKAAVYKMIFDDWKYYIGSSVDVLLRMRSWKYRLTAGERKNVDLLEVYNNSKQVRFEVVHFVDNPADVRSKEDFYIKEVWGDPLLLNKAPTAFGNKGVRQSVNRIKSSMCVRVAKVDEFENIIEVYDSVVEAFRKQGLKSGNRDVFKKYGLRTGGVILRKLDSDGNVIIPPIIPNKPKIKGYHRRRSPQESIDRLREKLITGYANGEYSKPEHCKVINKYTPKGEFVQSFGSIREAAKHSGTDKSNFKKALTGPTGFHKGFIYKVA